MINVQKLIAAYESDVNALGQRTENATAEIREKLTPYIAAGVFTEQDIAPLADKLIAAEKAEFDARWGVLKDFIEDEPKEPVEPEIEPIDEPSNDTAEIPAYKAPIDENNTTI